MIIGYKKDSFGGWGLFEVAERAAIHFRLQVLGDRAAWCRGFRLRAWKQTFCTQNSQLLVT